MKKDKQLKDRYGKVAESMVAYYHHLDLRGFDDLDDDVFAYIMKKVKGINMLDLNETAITNSSIKLLTSLEYVKELRAKSCQLLDDDCATDLNTITSLEFLHLKNTSVTIDGLLKLKDLSHLKTLLFSAADVAAIKEKMLQLKMMLPGCGFIIDSKAYYFNAIDLFVYAVKKQPYTYKLKIKNEAPDVTWSNWLIQPVGDYIEAERQGPYAVNDIEWIEIDPIEKRTAGRLIAEKEVDHTAAIIQLLERLEFPFMVTDRIISFYIVQRKL